MIPRRSWTANKVLTLSNGDEMMDWAAPATAPARNVIIIRSWVGREVVCGAVGEVERVEGEEREGLFWRLREREVRYDSTVV